MGLILKRPNPLTFSVISTLLILFLLIGPLEAIMIKLTLEQLVQRSDAIILGKVKEIECQWSMDQSVILTVVSIQVHEILAGEITNSQILVQYPGGEVGDIGLKVSDMPTFHPNEIVLLFLKKLANPLDIQNSPIITLNLYPAFNVVGQAQGKYFIDSEGWAHKSGYIIYPGHDNRDESIHVNELKERIRVINDILLKANKKAHEQKKY